VSIGVDLVAIDRVASSVAAFGERYLKRVYTAGEIEYANAGVSAAQRNERLAARFAAKEATMKALDLSEHGVAWTDIEVRRARSGGCKIALFGRAREAAEAAGIEDVAVSLSHDGDYAIAFVVARSRSDRDDEART